MVYHDVTAEHVHSGYGDEWDASLEVALPQGFMLGTAYADFKSGAAFPDKAVLWIYGGYRH